LYLYGGIPFAETLDQELRMKEECHQHNPNGQVHITKDFDCHYFLAHPRGIINPSLLDRDLKEATEFSEKLDCEWTYCTNTEDVDLVNPLNIFFLKEIKKLKNLKEIVIYAPSFFNRLLLKIAAPLIRPDRIIKDKKEFEDFLNDLKNNKKINH